MHPNRPQIIVYALVLCGAEILLLHGLEGFSHACLSSPQGLLDAAADTSGRSGNDRGRRNVTITVTGTVRHERAGQPCASWCGASVSGGHNRGVRRSGPGLGRRTSQILNMHNRTSNDVGREVRAGARCALRRS